MTGVLGAVAAMYGTSAPSATVTLDNHVIELENYGSVTVSYGVNNNRSVTDSDSTLENWLSSGGTVGNYEVMATKTSGTSPSGSNLNNWLSLSTSRAWSLTNSNGDNSTRTCVLSVSIRLASSGVVQDTATITLRATSNRP